MKHYLFLISLCISNRIIASQETIITVKKDILISFAQANDLIYNHLHHCFYTLDKKKSFATLESVIKKIGPSLQDIPCLECVCMFENYTSWKLHWVLFHHSLEKKYAKRRGRQPRNRLVSPYYRLYDLYNLKLLSYTCAALIESAPNTIN